MCVFYWFSEPRSIVLFGLRSMELMLFLLKEEYYFTSIYQIDFEFQNKALIIVQQFVALLMVPTIYKIFHK